MTVTQSEFTRGIFDPALPAPVGLQNADGTQAHKRFDVYRNNVAVGLSDALEAAFPVVRKLVGDEFFRAMAGVYLRKHKPRSPLMMFYGDMMPAFLGRFQPAKSVPYLPDVARVEVAMRAAYHAADATPIDGPALANVAPQDLMGLVLKLAPATHVLTSKYAVHDIYVANTQPDAPKPGQGPQSILITRPQFDPQIHLIDADAALCITALQDGQPLGLAMNAAGPDLDLGAVLGLLLSQNAIIALN